MADVDEIVGTPEPAAPDDWRIGLAAELVAGDGTVLGKAVVLSPNVAVTTASVASRAQTISQPAANANVSPAPLGVLFPQHGPSSYPVPANIQGIDGELRFGVVNVFGQMPVALPSGMLGTGELPADGAECSVIYAEDPVKGFFRIAGQIENRPGGSFVLYVDRLPSDSSQLTGAPVFFEDRLVGMVVGGPSRSVGNTFLLGVTSVRGMALSAAGSAVRALLPWIPDETSPGAEAPNQQAYENAALKGRSFTSGGAGVGGRSSTSPDEAVANSPAFPQNAESAAPIEESLYQSKTREVKEDLILDAMKRANGNVEEAAKTLGLHPNYLQRLIRNLSLAEKVQSPGASELDKDLWTRLSPSGRRVLERAVGVLLKIRQGKPPDKVHMEHFVVGLFDSWRGFFARREMDGGRLRNIIRETVGTDIPSDYQTVELFGMPGLSKHVAEALMLAAKCADERGARQIWSTHLLYGALSVAECQMVQALNAAGIRLEDLRREDVSPEDRDLEAQLSSTAGIAPEISDPDLFARLSVSSRAALGRAEALRSRARQDKIHMEHLIAGLFDKLGGPTYRLFLSEKIDRSKLMRVVRETVGNEIPDGYRATEITALPPLSTHVRQALEAAAKVAETSGLIRSRHLLYGALSIEDCKMIRALTALGVNKDRIALYDEEADVDGDSSPSPNAAPSVVDLKVETRTEATATTTPLVAPTPKVDSDLWSEQDRLGYEAYARTIATLITHKDTVAPLTIGIKAPWGAGKTSLMKRVQHLLDGRAELSEENRSGARQQGQAPKMTLLELLRELKQITKADKGTLKPGEMPKLPVPSNKDGAERYGLPPRITVWFNAWKYQTSEQIWAGMAHCIISQVTARMSPLEREVFWLRLHARRINTDEVRRQVHELLIKSIVPVALMIVVVCAIVIWVASLAPLLMPYQWSVRVVTSLAGLIGVIWKARDTLGEKAAGTMKELVREPDYEGKMGYLHLVESDIREVLNLVTEATSPESRVLSPEQKSATGGESRVLSPESKPPLPRTNREKGGAPQRGNASAATQTPLVVFVDDLDRCAPNKVAEVVEAINLFLCGDYPNCIFVLGMEPGMVAAALEVANKEVIEKALEMGVADRTAPVGWRFMEKIVQLPIMIPPPTKEGRDLYVKSLTGLPGMYASRAQMQGGTLRLKADAVAGGAKSPESTKVGPVEPQPLDEKEVVRYMGELEAATLKELEVKSEKVLAEVPTEKRMEAAEASKRVYARTFSERDPEIVEFVGEVANLVDGNPRQIKRFVNVFRFYSTLRHSLRVDGVVAAADLPSDRVLAKFVALSVQWPHAMDCLRARNCVGADGKWISRLEYLEGESSKITGNDVAGDESWKKIIEGLGPGVGSWAQARGFRSFLAQGESLGRSGGHGMW